MIYSVTGAGPDTIEPEEPGQDEQQGKEENEDIFQDLCYFLWIKAL
jgi:hypothetical protein